MSEHPPATILCVEDDAINRQIFCWWLQEAGFRVLEAENGRQALELAKLKPDLVILDLGLPDILGFEVFRQLRENPVTRDVAVLFISAVYVGTNDRLEGLEQGADAYLVKPVQQREMIAHVRALLRTRAAEEAYRQAAQEWRATFDAISDGVCLLGRDGGIVRCNRALADLLGCGFEGLLGQPIGEALRRGLKLDAVPSAIPWTGWDRAETCEVQLGARWFRVRTDPILDEQAGGTRSVLTLTDITQRKNLEEQLRQGQRLEAIGRLAGGIAHDFNNLLTAILGSASLIQRGSQANEAVHGTPLLETIERAAWRAADLTRQLLGFSRQTLLWLRTAEVRNVIEETERAVRPNLPAGVELTVSCPDGLWQVHADPGQLEQVLAHLCANATDAMPEGGKLRLEAANVELGPQDVAHHLEARAGKFVRIRVEDTGAGIPADVLDKVFDPFFTTKPVGRGSGLGLAMVHGIIKQHQGWIECHSPPGKGGETCSEFPPHEGASVEHPPSGTRFDIYLPKMADPDPPPSAETQEAAEPPAAAPPAGARVVLLAEDNETLRRLATTYLQSGGFEVIEAADGMEAADVYRREHARIDVVVLDHLMPLLTGGEAVAEIRRINPEARIVMAAGSASGTMTADDVAAVVSKPYRERELLQAVRAALGSAQA